MIEHLSAEERHDLFVAADDTRRQLAAFVDGLVSIAMFALMIAVMAATGAGDSALFFVAVVVFWGADIALYAYPVSRTGWSVGGWVTGRRVVNRDTGESLSLGRAIQRYFARRWAALFLRRELHRPAHLRSPKCRELDDVTASRVDLEVGSATIRAADLADANPSHAVQPRAVPG